MLDIKNKTNIMGILNVTPDSFSDGGRFNTMDAALFHAERMIEEGANVLDIGGESTRPGYTPVSEDEEISRVAPVIREIKKRFDIVISIDTCKPAVARAALCEGAEIVNDIRGVYCDPDMLETVCKTGALYVLMHNKEKPVYRDFLNDVKEELKIAAKKAVESGIPEEKIILDPGVGFGKTYEQNLCILNNLGYFCDAGFPMLLGASRKSVIGKTLELSEDERLEGTIATSVLAAVSGYAFVRVHDVKENKRAVDMTMAIRGGF